MSRIVLSIYKLAFFLYQLKVPVLPRLICKLFIRIPFGCQIGLGAQFGSKVCLAYGGLGTVIASKAIIGSNVYIGTGVTIGGTNNSEIFPVIKDNCLISTGAKINGPLTIGPWQCCRSQLPS